MWYSLEVIGKLVRAVRGDGQVHRPGDLAGRYGCAADAARGGCTNVFCALCAMVASGAPLWLIVRGVARTLWHWLDAERFVAALWYGETYHTERS